MSKETVQKLQQLAQLADAADGRTDGKIQRSTIENPTGEMVQLAMFDGEVRSALSQLQREIPKGQNTFKVPTERELEQLVVRAENYRPPAPPCKETWIAGMFEAPSWLPDGMKTKVCPKR